MKQWVKDYLEDATYVLDYKNGASTAEVDYTEFAERIVHECIKICGSRVGNSDYNTGRMHCASDIREHFGIKSGISEDS